MLPTTVETQVKFSAGGILFNSLEDLCRFWRISKKEIVLHMRTAHCSLQVALEFLAESSKAKQSVPAQTMTSSKETIVPKTERGDRGFGSTGR